MIKRFIITSYFSIILIFNYLYSQRLDHIQGQLIVWCENNEAFVNSVSVINGGKENSIIMGTDVISKEWNIHLLKFDHAKYSIDALILELKNCVGVKFAQKNHRNTFRKVPNDTYFSKQWHHLNTGSEGGILGADFRTTLAWDHTTGGLTEDGDTIVVCIIDGGVELNHADLKTNFWVNYKEIPGNNIDDDNNGYTDDYYGWNADSSNDKFLENAHGTSVAGIVGAISNNRVGVAGINWNVKMLMVQGGGDDVSVIKSYTYPFYLRKLYNESNGRRGAYIVATNSSWGRDRGRPEDSPIWCAMYDSLGSVGILNVGSTANIDINVDEEGDLPTNCESDFLVGVTNLNWNDQKEKRAGYGIKSIDLGSYGEAVFTTTTPNTFRVFGGTSAAAPQVSGAIGLLYSLPCSNLPSLSKSNPDQAALLVKSIILQQTRKLNSLRNLVQTSGVMNIYDAMFSIHPMNVKVEDNQVIFQSFNTIPTSTILYFRKLGNTKWEEFKIENNQRLIISSLEKCSVYEYQVSGICPRYQSIPSKINIITTEGCCTEPKQIQIIENGLDNVIVQFKDIDKNTNFFYYVQEEGRNKMDTFEVKNNLESIITINGLKRCSRYNIRISLLCEGIPSPVSKPMVIETSGCDQCDDIDYCQRDKPTGDFEWIEAITIDTNTFVSGVNNGYGDFVGNNLSFILLKNENHTIDVIPGFSLDSNFLYIAAWIDFNHNSILENSENVFPEGFQSNTSSKVTFNILSNTRLGYTRMRVVVKYGENGIPAPTPCFIGVEFGEYEDYCVQIVDQKCFSPIKVIENSKTINSVSLEVSKNNLNDIISYVYRKLPYGLWSEGSVFGTTINLAKLDSCSNYEIRLTNSCINSTSETLDYYFDTKSSACFIGTKNTSINSVKLYPNPIHDYLFIESDSPIKQINLYNVDGRLIQSSKQNIKLARINLQLSSGVYIVEILDSNNERIIRKFIKE